MPDLSHFYGGDLTLSDTGDLASVDGLAMTTQRLIRRLMTAVKGYIWHIDYGAGIPQEIGRTTDGGRIKALVISQIFSEDSVAANPPPQITLAPILNGVAVHVVYWSKLSGQQESLSFDINR